MKHKITNYGIQKLLENFTDERSFYLNMGYQFSDVMYMKLETVRSVLTDKVEISNKARQRVVDEFVKGGKATKVPIDGQADIYQLNVKEEYIKDINSRLANILNTEVLVELEDFSIEEFEEVLGKKGNWKLSIPNRKFINLLCAVNE
mgnify:FL=1|jgi:hypothetical protein